MLESWSSLNPKPKTVLGQSFGLWGGARCSLASKHHRSDVLPIENIKGSLAWGALGKSYGKLVGIQGLRNKAMNLKELPSTSSNES